MVQGDSCPRAGHWFHVGVQLGNGLSGQQAEELRRKESELRTKEEELARRKEKEILRKEQELLRREQELRQRDEEEMRQKAQELRREQDAVNPVQTRLCAWLCLQREMVSGFPVLRQLDCCDAGPRALYPATLRALPPILDLGVA